MRDDDLLALLGHELRTPLNAVLGLNRLALEEDLPPQARAWLERSHAQSQHLLELVQDLLDWGRLEAGAMQLAHRAFDPCAVLEEVVQAQGPGEVAIQLHADAPIVRGDDVRWRQVVQNLVSNARKYTHQGEIEVTLRHRLHQGRVRLTLKVRDTGIGIHTRDLERIFERFYRAEQTTTGRASGTGLGLPISRRLAEVMGGRLTVRSHPGEGSTFTLRVELDPGVLEVPHAVGPGPVLVVEDAPDGREVLQRHLERHGRRVDVAATGLQAIHQARRHRYALILMDLDLPDLDGLEACRRILTQAREDGRSAPAIYACTAHDGPDLRQRCNEAGMRGFFSKPPPSLESLLGDATGDLEDLSDLLPLFRHERRLDRQALATAIATADETAIRRIGHRLQGASAILGIDTLERLGRRLRQGESDDALERLDLWLQDQESERA